MAWFVDLFRKRNSDRERALRAVEYARQHEHRRLAAAFDAFVPYAESVEEGLLLGTANASDGRAVPIRLPYGQEQCHWATYGGTGSGKTTFVAGILRDMLCAGRPFGLADAKGDLFAMMLRWSAAIGHRLPEAEREKLRNRIVVLNPFGTHLVPMNVCRPFAGIPPEAQAFEVALALSRLFGNELSDNMQHVLRHLLLLLMDSALTLNEAPRILQDEVLRGALAARSKNEALREFFFGQYPLIPQVSKDALQNRLQALLAAPPIRLMLGADALINFRVVFDHGLPLYIFLGRGAAASEEATLTIGALIMQLAFQAAYSRGQGAHAGYLLAADEFSNLLESPGLARRFSTALTSIRSFGLSLMLIGHHAAQMPPALRAIAIANIDIVSLFRTSRANAAHFGDFLPDIDEETLAEALEHPSRNRSTLETSRRDQAHLIQQLPNRTCFWYDRRQTHGAIRIRVPDLEAPHKFAGVSEGELERIVSAEGWDIGAAWPKEVLQRQIDARAARLQELVAPPVVVTERTEKRDGTRRRPRSRPSLG